VVRHEEHRVPVRVGARAIPQVAAEELSDGVAQLPGDARQMGDVDGRVGEGHVGEVDDAGAAAVEAQVRFVEVAVDGPRGHGGVDEQVLGAGEDGVDAVAFDGGEGGGHVFPDALNQCPVLYREPGFADVRRLEGVQPGQGARDRLDDSR